MHNALYWMQKHKLHEILIQNPQFDDVTYDSSCSSGSEMQTSNLSCEISKTLNPEQQLAVQQIVWAQNSVPFIVYGPPGKLTTQN